MSLDRDEAVAAERLERWAAEIERIDSDPPNPGSWRFSANRLRETNDPVSLRRELTIVINKLEQKFPSAGSGA
jgi:hypothetical protein